MRISASLICEITLVQYCNSVQPPTLPTDEYTSAVSIRAAAVLLYTCTYTRSTAVHSTALLDVIFNISRDSSPQLDDEGSFCCCLLPEYFVDGRSMNPGQSIPLETNELVTIAAVSFFFFFVSIVGNRVRPLSTSNIRSACHCGPTRPRTCTHIVKTRVALEVGIIFSGTVMTECTWYQVGKYFLVFLFVRASHLGIQRHFFAQHARIRRA